MEVISLLEAKSKCLARFLKLTTEGLERLKSGQFDTLAELEKNRDTLVKAIQLYDKQLAHEAQLLAQEAISDSFRLQIQTLLSEQEKSLLEIQSADHLVSLQILAEQGRIQAELDAALKTRGSLESHSKFKSRWTPESGGGLDQKL